MTCVYYNNDTKLITQMSPIPDSSAADPDIIISDTDLALLASHKMHLQLFLVEVTDPAEHVGKIIKRPSDPKVITSQKPDGRRYAIPTTANATVDVYVKQFRSNKSIQVSIGLGAVTNADAIGRPMLLMACLKNDPHYPVHELIIPANTLSTDPMIYTYTGSDNICFYTYKTFENYLHEQFD